jgi:hypothetical protein
MIIPDKKTKSYLVWDLKQLLKENELTHEQFVKIAIVLGCDFMKNKTIFKGIGFKTVVKKVKSNVLDEKFKLPEVVKAIQMYKNCIEDEKYPTISDFKNSNACPLSNLENHKKLVDWMVEKNFNKERIETAIVKAIDSVKSKKLVE